MTKISLPSSSKLLQPEFTFGVATSSFQIEGAASTREPSIWDTFCATPGRIKDGSDGLTACDHVARWREDVELIAQLGVQAYRFSIAWGRVINRDGSTNQAGLQFYVDLVKALRARDIEAHVTLYHWDLPQFLDDQGGWLQRDIVQHFAHYAEVVVRALGDQVTSYATLNEPFCSAYLSYEAGIHAPGRRNRAEGRLAAHHLLLAHGTALPILRQHAPNAQHGIVLNFSPCHPASHAQADVDAALLAHQYHNLWYLQPILRGSYPDLVHPIAAADMPDIKPGDMDIISQPIDFLGVNYYTRTVFKAAQRKGLPWFSDVPPTQPPLTTMGWEIYPDGLVEILTDLNTTFGELPPIYITENGAAFADELVQENSEMRVHDTARIAYYQSHLRAVHQCVEAGINMQGYFAWSLLDNFEWAEGYSKRFGIVHVDFATQVRTLKDSARALQQFWLQRKAQMTAVEAL